METLLAIAIAVIVGGVIGYVTNKIAVMMLFHPVRPIGIGSLKIQGLIPARRRQLAARLLGITVKYMNSEDFEFLIRRAVEKGVLEDLVREKTSETLKSSRLYRLISGLNKEAGEKLVELVTSAVSRAVEDYLRDVGYELSSKLAENIELEELVMSKAENIDVEEVERMFRRVAGPELRDIEIAGFFLGALIGLLQGIINYVLIPMI